MPAVACPHRYNRRMHHPSGCSPRTSLLTTLSAQTAPVPPAPDQPILAPIQALFAAMTQRNSAAVQAAFLPGAILLSLHDGKPTQLTAEAFAERIAKPSSMHIEERIHDPLIHVDRDLAVVWAPFDFPHRRQDRPLWHRPLQPGSDQWHLAHSQHHLEFHQHLSRHPLNPRRKPLPLPPPLLQP